MSVRSLPVRSVLRRAVAAIVRLQLRHPVLVLGVIAVLTAVSGRRLSNPVSSRSRVARSTESAVSAAMTERTRTGWRS